MTFGTRNQFGRRTALGSLALAQIAGAQASACQQPLAARTSVGNVTQPNFGVNTGQQLGTTSPRPTAPAYHDGKTGTNKVTAGKNRLAVDPNVLAATSLGRAATQARLRC